MSFPPAVGVRSRYVWSFPRGACSPPRRFGPLIAGVPHIHLLFEFFCVIFYYSDNYMFGARPPSGNANVVGDGLFFL